MYTNKPRLAIIGAGLSGLLLARQLSADADCELFEKSRGLGGRLATRYADDYQFDHGAPGFIATSAAFQAFVQTLEQAGVVAPWRTTQTQLQLGKVPVMREHPVCHYVGTPRMNQIGKYLAQELVVRRQTRITQLQGEPYAWWLQDDAGHRHGPYQWVISTAPAVQTAALLSPHGLSAVQTVPMLGCYVLMLGLRQFLSLPWQIAAVTGTEVDRIILNHTKPGRLSGYSMVVHSTSAWAAEHDAADKDWVQAQLLQTTGQLLGQDLGELEHCALHLWRYATCAADTSATQHHIDTDTGLAACGDWCGAGTVEAAYHSACTTADAIRDQLN
jgi:predicted NAD/FAD-dependent oxidoreductase